MRRNIVVLVLGFAVLLLAQWQRDRDPVRERTRSMPAVASAGLKWGQPRTLEDHFQRHGGDFAASSAGDYAAQAAAFRERALREALPMKLDADGVLRVFDPATGAFGAYNRDGTTRTYFKPGSRDYFARQPGRPVRPGEVR